MERRIASLDLRPEAPDTSVLVVAPHALVRAGLKALLDASHGLAVVAEAADADEAAALAKRHEPAVVLLDGAPAEATTRAAASTIRRAVPAACILCLGRGADGADDELRCIPPEAGIDELCSSLSTMLGQRCSACAMRPRCAARHVAAALTPRETQVAVHVASGLSSKQIAATLGIGLRTVNTHRESIAKKLGSSSAAIVTRYVLEHGLLA